MDWEIYERYRSTLLLAGFLLVSSLLIGFRQTTPVRYLQSFLIRFALPPHQYLARLSQPAVTPQESVGLSPVTPESGEALAQEVIPGEASSAWAELRRKNQVLSEENKRFREVLRIKSDKWPKTVAAHVAGRDPQRWFQEIVIAKGTEDGLSVDDPVLAISDGREVLVGRVAEVSAQVSKVMLLQDSLSAVAAEVTGAAGEDGVVEGTNSHELLLKYLDRGSQVKIGDLVMSSGLGKTFPPGLPIGWVTEVQPDPTQLFLQARLRPATKSNAWRVVLVLTRNEAAL